MCLNHKSYLIAQAHAQSRLSLCLPGSIVVYVRMALTFPLKRVYSSGEVSKSLGDYQGNM